MVDRIILGIFFLVVAVFAIIGFVTTLIVVTIIQDEREKSRIERELNEKNKH